MPDITSYLSRCILFDGLGQKKGRLDSAINTILNYTYLPLFLQDLVSTPMETAEISKKKFCWSQTLKFEKKSLARMKSSAAPPHCNMLSLTTDCSGWYSVFITSQRHITIGEIHKNPLAQSADHLHTKMEYAVIEILVLMIRKKLSVFYLKHTSVLNFVRKYSLETVPEN